MTKPTLGIGMVGYAFMGAAHSHAWRTAAEFFDPPLQPRLRALVGRNTEAAQRTADRFEWESVTNHWQDLLERDDIDLIDICTPGDTHAEIAVAALETGKHVLCEKPLANTVDEAERMAKAATQAAGTSGARAMVGFTYRRTPAVSYARQLVAEGRLGTIRHVRAQFLQDWLSDENAPLNWRLDKTKAGSGALGDIGAHIVDMAQYVTGDQIARVNAMLETFVPTRPIEGVASGIGGVGSADAERGPVTVDDAVAFLARFEGGSFGTFEATRYANGRKNGLRLELNGTRGSLAFDFEDMNVLHFFDADQPPELQGFRRIVVTESGHPYIAAWWPPGHGLGYEHGFTHQAADFLNDIAAQRDPSPSFNDGYRVQQVLGAVEASAEDGSWRKVVS